jgi:hypothetical protein
MTMAIAHREGDRAVLDCVRERTPPFSPEEVVAEFAALLNSYRVKTVFGVAGEERGPQRDSKSTESVSTLRRK